MDLNNLLKVCEMYTKLGWAVQGQLRDYALEGIELDELNLNAVNQFTAFLKATLALTDYDEDLADELTDLIEQINDELEQLRDPESAGC